MAMVYCLERRWLSIQHTERLTVRLSSRVLGSMGGLLNAVRQMGPLPHGCISTEPQRLHAVGRACHFCWVVPFPLHGFTGSCIFLSTVLSTFTVILRWLKFELQRGKVHPPARSLLSLRGRRSCNRLSFQRCTMSAAEVKSALEQLAGSLAAQGHHLQAIKCYTAILGQSLLPADEAATRLKLAQLLLEHTTNVADAKQHLQKAVS